MTAPQDLQDFVAREHARLVGALDLYCGDLGVAEELADEALVRVCERWEVVRTMDRPGAWAHRVAMNLAKSHLRRLYAERRAVARTAARTPGVALDDDPTDAVVLREALALLRPKQRQALILRYYLDLPAEEVGALMGSSAGAIRVQTHRAIQRLRELLGDAGPEAIREGMDG